METRTWNLMFVSPFILTVLTNGLVTHNGLTYDFNNDGHNVTQQLHSRYAQFYLRIIWLFTSLIPTHLPYAPPTNDSFLFIRIISLMVLWLIQYTLKCCLKPHWMRSVTGLPIHLVRNTLIKLLSSEFHTVIYLKQRTKN